MVKRRKLGEGKEREFERLKDNETPRLWQGSEKEG